MILYDILGLSFMMACLTDCSQSASELGHHPEQEFNDQDREEAKEEARVGFMDFPVRDVAEQLTRLDAVGPIGEKKCRCHCWCLAHAACVSGPLCQGGALSLPGLHLVSAGQEGKPKPGTERARHHLPVQRGDQPRHHLPPLPPRPRASVLVSRVIAQRLLHLPVLRRRPELARLRSHRPRPQSPRHREVDLHCSGLEPECRFILFLGGIRSVSFRVFVRRPLKWGGYK